MALKTFTTFYLDDQLFGLDILFVREINKQFDLSPVPHAHDYVRGLINLRGQIVTIVDLKHLVGLGHAELTDRSHNVIIKTDAELSEIRYREDIDPEVSIPDKVSLLVDEIGDVVKIPEEEIDSPPGNIHSIDKKYLQGVVKLEKNLLTLLSLKHVLKG